MVAYATPSQLWTHCLNPQTLFQDGSIEPGTWTDPAAAGGNTGLGLVQVERTSNPRDAFTVKLLTVDPGELNTQTHPNPGLAPTFKVSLNNGVTYGAKVAPDNLGRLRWQAGGFTLILQNGTLGSQVTIGAGNAALNFRATRAGVTVTITQQTGKSAALSYTLLSNDLTLLLGTDDAEAPSTTATAAAAYLSSKGLPIQVTAGGTGAGIVQVAAKNALPFASFAAGDAWTFTTTASPDVMAALEAGADFMRGYIRDSYQGVDQSADPLSSYGTAVAEKNCEYAAAKLLYRKERGKKWEVPAQVQDWLNEVATGHIQPTLSEAGSPKSFATLVDPVDPLSRGGGAFPI